MLDEGRLDAGVPGHIMRIVSKILRHLSPLMKVRLQARQQNPRNVIRDFCVRHALVQHSLFLCEGFPRSQP